MRLRILALFALASSCAFAQLNVTGNISASQVTSGTFTISLIPTGTSSSTVAIGNDSRFLNATSLNGTSITSLTGVLKLTSGSPSNAAASDLIALWSGTCSSSTYLRGDGACSTPGGGGTVTSFSAGTLSPLFTTTVSTATSTPALSFTLTSAGAHQFLGNNTGSTAAPSYVQPAFTDISGTVAATQLPNPSASTLGGVESIAASANKWVNSISTSGVPSLTQPAFSDISGSVTAAQLPTSTQVWNKYTIPYTGVQTASTANAVTIVSLTARQAVCGLVEKHTTAFAGTSITGLTVTVGDSNGTSTFYSPTAFNALQAVSNTAFVATNVLGMASFAGGTIQANFTATGANLSALTAGSIDFDVCVVTLP